MRWEQVCEIPPTVVGHEGRHRWRDDGYLLFPGLIEADRLRALRDALDRVVEESRNLTESTTMIDLEPGHSAAAPRLRRASCLNDVDPVFWDFCRDSVLVDIAADILGPNVRFREAYANLKWSGGGAEVQWHQDLAFYPHTNTGTCQFIVQLGDVTPDRAPLRLLPGSHQGPLYSHYRRDGEWAGAIDLDLLADLDLEAAIELTGPAGSVSVHHGLMLHWSAPNHSDTSRPALVITYTAADSIPYTSAPYPSSHYGQIVRGVEPGVAQHDELTLILPPDWSGGYISLFEHQKSDNQSPPAT